MGRTTTSAAALATLTGAALALAGTPAHAADLTSTEVLTVDTHRTTEPNAGSAGPVSTTGDLVAGRGYVVTAQGTWSPYDRALFDTPGIEVCGTPEAAPLFGTAGRTGPVGGDPEWTFAALTGGSCAASDAKLPARAASFQLSTGGAFAHPETTTAGTGPTADHAYQYRVVGEGRPLAARVVDEELRDNYGVFRISVTPEGAPVRTSAPSTSPTAAAASAATAPLVTGTGGAGAGRICSSRRTITVHVRKRDVRRLTATFRGKRLKAGRGATKVRYVLDLRKLPKARYSVLLDLRLRDGRHFHITRRFYTCTKKRVSPDATTVRRVR